MNLGGTFGTGLSPHYQYFCGAFCVGSEQSYHTILIRENRALANSRWLGSVTLCLFVRQFFQEVKKASLVIGFSSLAWIAIK